MKNRTWLILLITIVFSLTYAGCTKSDTAAYLGNWSEMSAFSGTARQGAFAFTIENIGYVGGGYNDKYLKSTMLRDVYSYQSDNSLGVWAQVDNFPAAAGPRMQAVGFSIGKFGYVGTGYNKANPAYYRDFWKFDPSAAAGSQWTKVDSLPGYARYGAIAFSINGKGYVGCGTAEDGTVKKDFYEFNPDAAEGHQWTAINFIGKPRTGGTTFVIDNKAYIVGGSSGSDYADDFIGFDGTTFYTLRDPYPRTSQSFDDDYTDIERVNGLGFSANGKGYITSGYNSSAIANTTWEYDPKVDFWYRKNAMKNNGRNLAVAFSMTNNRVFVATGIYGSLYYQDIWEFNPTAIYNENF